MRTSDLSRAVRAAWLRLRVLAALVAAWSRELARRVRPWPTVEPRPFPCVACNVEYGVVDTAREAYITLNGEPPKQTSDLLQVIKDLPTYIEVETDGSLGLTALEECVMWTVKELTS